MFSWAISSSIRADSLLNDSRQRFKTGSTFVRRLLRSKLLKQHVHPDSGNGISLFLERTVNEIESHHSTQTLLTAALPAFSFGSNPPLSPTSSVFKKVPRIKVALSVFFSDPAARKLEGTASANWPELSTHPMRLTG